MRKETTKDKLFIAVMGAGTIGLRHIEVVKASEDCDLAAIVDPRWEEGEPPAPLHPSLDALFDNARPDGVIVSTPTALHEEHVLACVGQGIPTLVEKPIAADLNQARRMEEAVAKSGVPVLVGHVRRHSSVIAAAKRALDDGLLGEVIAMSAMWCVYKPPHYFNKPWRQRGGGGPILINVNHDIDLMRHLLGEVAEVRSMIAPPRRGQETEDTAVVMLRFESGALGTITSSDIATSPWSWELSAPDKTSFDHPKAGQDCYQICGTKGALGLPTMRLWQHEGEPDWCAPIDLDTLDLSQGTAMELQLEHFLDVIRGNAQPLSSVPDAVKTLDVTLRVLEDAP